MDKKDINLDDSFRDIERIFKKRDALRARDELYRRSNSSGDRVRASQEKLEAMKKKSQTSCNEKYQAKTAKAKSSFLSKAIIVALSLAITLSVGTGLVRDIHETNVRQEMIMDNTSFMANATYTYPNFERQEYITMYFEDEIGDAILKYDGDIDLDTLIYMTYKRINYDVIGTLNKVFYYMNNAITNNPENYSDEIKKSCQYSSFDEYIFAHGFEDVESYKKTMQKILEAYSKDQVANDNLNELLDEIRVEEVPNYGGIKNNG